MSDANNNIFDKEIITGKKCPYCKKYTEYVDSSIIYGKSYGMVYLCRDCDAYVGVHDGTDKAKGRLADKNLRYHKKMAHKYFDNLWQRKMKKTKIRKGHARAKAYKWLAEELGIDSKFAHIGMFNVKLCKKVQSLCKLYSCQK
jgi:hypothetical protein